MNRFTSLLRLGGEAPSRVQARARLDLPDLLNTVGFDHGVDAAKAAAERGEPVLLVAAWSSYSMELLDEWAGRTAFDDPRPTVLDMNDFPTRDAAVAALPGLAGFETVPALLVHGTVVTGREAVRRRLDAWKVASASKELAVA